MDVVCIEMRRMFALLIFGERQLRIEMLYLLGTNHIEFRIISKMIEVDGFKFGPHFLFKGRVVLKMNFDLLVE